MKTLNKSDNPYKTTDRKTSILLKSNANCKTDLCGTSGITSSVTSLLILEGLDTRLLRSKTYFDGTALGGPCS